MSGSLRGLPGTVWMLGAISLLNDAASDLVYPLVPLFLVTVLGAGAQALSRAPPPRVLVLGSGLGLLNIYVALTFGVR